MRSLGNWQLQNKRRWFYKVFELFFKKSTHGGNGLKNRNLVLTTCLTPTPATPRPGVGWRGEQFVKQALTIVPNYFGGTGDSVSRMSVLSFSRKTHMYM
jgi:hypothetical protein